MEQLVGASEFGPRSRLRDEKSGHAHIQSLGRAGIAVVLVAAFIGAFAAPATAQTLPATLTGEQLTSLPGVNGTESVSVTCNPTSTSSGTFTATGIAIGPYPGTFTESGSFSFGPLGTVSVLNPNPLFTAGYGQVTTFDTTFTINSGTTRITGSKQAGLFVSPTGSSVGLAQTFGTCVDYTATAGSQVLGHTVISQVDANTIYQATISRPSGDFADHGGAEVELHGVNDPNLGNVPAGDAFREQFVLSGGLVPLCDENLQANQNQGNNSQGCANP